MKKFYIQHHFASLFIVALLATFVTILYYTEIVPAEANPAPLPTPSAVMINSTPTATPAPTPGDTTGIVLWGFVIVTIIFLGMLFSRRSLLRRQ